jgi:mannose-6-phosphate isomerase-like protein (cupin superfamily)
MSTSRSHVPQTEPFRWVGVEEHAYKETDGTFKDVTRRILCCDESQGTETRYFEVGVGGHTTLEKHEHTHVVVPIRGRGRALIGDHVVDLAPHDVVFVPPWAWHQFQATADEPLGFLCTVKLERDRPTLPTLAELDELRADPTLANFIRARA